MSSNINNNIERILETPDIILELCSHMDELQIVAFARTCRTVYQTISVYSSPWKQKYVDNFCLGDPREQEWMRWFIWLSDSTSESDPLVPGENKKKRKRSPSAEATTGNDANDESLIPRLETVSWFRAYLRRKKTEHNLMIGRFNRQECDLSVRKGRRLEIVNLNPWNALIWDQEKAKVWSIAHYMISENDGQSKIMAQQELTNVLPRLLGDKPSIYSVYGTTRFAVAQLYINTYADIESVLFGDPVCK
ncbi:hypothetical protein BDF19DRAFT_173149 [Syncephalis fuscata]|nr:hypothetical protein BDF19DRAFT_173149 [Syncephalis fuscata]